jgi:thiosulfate/3-mercaptopyruvate sulfurtransferase
VDANEILIEPSELAAAMAAGALLIDARKAGEFRKGHIPGAMPFSTYESFVADSSSDGMRLFAKAIAFRFMGIGVRLDRPVIVYEEDTGMRAAREAWLLEFLGHRRTRILHGGLKGWIAAGGPVLNDEDVITAQRGHLEVPAIFGHDVAADEVAYRAGSDNFVIIDVRDDLEWAGKDDTPCCARRGHIPHAVHIEWTRFLENGRFKSPAAINAVLAGHGVNPRNEIAVYCHRGARSANAYYALKYAGVPYVRNFIGSWHEWSARTELPVA